MTLTLKAVLKETQTLSLKLRRNSHFHSSNFDFMVSIITNDKDENDLFPMR